MVFQPELVMNVLMEADDIYFWKNLVPGLKNHDSHNCSAHL